MGMAGGGGDSTSAPVRGVRQACNAENNIPTVGPEQGRAVRMHWLRVERLLGRRLSALRLKFPPVMCSSATHAPCGRVPRPMRATHAEASTATPSTTVHRHALLPKRVPYNVASSTSQPAVAKPLHLS